LTGTSSDYSFGAGAGIDTPFLKYPSGSRQIRNSVATSVGFGGYHFGVSHETGGVLAWIF